LVSGNERHSSNNRTAGPMSEVSRSRIIKDMPIAITEWL
jgi:hypothetical protein